MDLSGPTSDFGSRFLPPSSYGHIRAGHARTDKPAEHRIVKQQSRGYVEAAVAAAPLLVGSNGNRLHQ